MQKNLYFKGGGTKPPLSNIWKYGGGGSITSQILNLEIRGEGGCKISRILNLPAGKSDIMIISYILL